MVRPQPYVRHDVASGAVRRSASASYGRGCGRAIHVPGKVGVSVAVDALNYLGCGIALLVQTSAAPRDIPLDLKGAVRRRRGGLCKSTGKARPPRRPWIRSIAPLSLIHQTRNSHKTALSLSAVAS